MEKVGYALKHPSSDTYSTYAIFLAFPAKLGLGRRLWGRQGGVETFKAGGKVGRTMKNSLLYMFQASYSEHIKKILQVVKIKMGQQFVSKQPCSVPIHWWKVRTGTIFLESTVATWVSTFRKFACYGIYLQFGQRFRHQDSKQRCPRVQLGGINYCPITQWSTDDDKIQ